MRDCWCHKLVASLPSFAVRYLCPWTRILADASERSDLDEFGRLPERHFAYQTEIFPRRQRLPYSRVDREQNLNADKPADQSSVTWGCRLHWRLVEWDDMLSRHLG